MALHNTMLYSNYVERPLLHDKQGKEGRRKKVDRHKRGGGEKMLVAKVKVE